MYREHDLEYQPFLTRDDYSDTSSSFPSCPQSPELSEPPSPTPTPTSLRENFEIDDKYAHLLPKSRLKWYKWLVVGGSAIVSSLLAFGVTILFIHYLHFESSLRYDQQTAKIPILKQGEIISHNDTILDTPTIRDMSAYVIDPLWPYDAPPVIREFNWTITDAILNPDGVYRPMILINNQFPGPLIEVNENDYIIVNIDNQAVNATAIHFHGMFQNGTNHMDGTVGVTQCPIAPNTQYTYNFTVSGQSGTYWYHAHHTAQASDGLFGPMVVHTQKERTELQKIKYDTDRVLMFHDHYQDTTSELLMEYLAPGRENEEPVPDSPLINGRGVRNCSEFPHRQSCDDSTQKYPEIHLLRGQKHRLRILNTGAFATFQVQIDEHLFHVTEVDGTDVFPEEFHRLELMPAQRYSIIVDANQKSDAFWLRGRFVTHCFRHDNDYMRPNIEIIIRYVDTKKPSESSMTNPTSKDWSEAIDVVCKDLNSSMLHPVSQLTIPESSGLLHIKAAFHIGDWTLARGFMNESTWHMNVSSPTLNRILEADASSLAFPSEITDTKHDHGDNYVVNNWLFDSSKEFVVQTQGIKTVDIAINNFDDGSHPFHLHGHKFWVLTESSLGYPPKGPELDEFLERTGALNNPVLRDTVTVQAYQWALVRVTLDNPGVWAFHCHNLWHAESGMGMQFLVRGDELVGKGVGDAERALCLAPGIEKGMKPSDKIWEGHF